jgi:hypothetical protein
MADMMMPNIMAASFLPDRACRLYRSMHPSRLFKKSTSFVLAWPPGTMKHETMVSRGAAALFGTRRISARQGWAGEESDLFEQPADCAGIVCDPFHPTVPRALDYFSTRYKNPATTSHTSDSSSMMSNRFFMMMCVTEGPLLVNRANFIAQAYSAKRDHVLSAQPVDGEK